jgi:glycine dehydrogenase subunit 2
LSEEIIPEKLIFELSHPGNCAVFLPESDVPPCTLPSSWLRNELNLPELSEIEVVRHFTGLSRRNFGVDLGFYPLGSCTMKYNPKINEDLAALPGFSGVHPYTDEEQIQGILELLYNFEQYLKALLGFSAYTFQPAAGAQGELTALMMMKKYHEDAFKVQSAKFKAQSQKSDVQCPRNEIIVPDSSHGTNPASVTMVGYKTVVVKSNARGGVDMDELKKAVSERTAGMMLTNPNTLGIFDENILQISEVIHKAGGLMYYDGANANALLGKCRPVDLGFDLAHFNLHKSFAAPHGGGGPGAGPVGVVEKLVPYLPNPRIVKKPDQSYGFDSSSCQSIGKVHSFYGNIGVILKAFCYIKLLGKNIASVSEDAVLSANYVMHKLKDYYYLPYNQTCQHEFVLSAKWQKEKYGISALDIAKRLIDFGFHPPTIYFPLIVEEALMIEPTETEAKATLDRFIEVMIQIAGECETSPDLVKSAPHHTPVSRLDETLAARSPRLKWENQP